MGALCIWYEGKLNNTTQVAIFTFSPIEQYCPGRDIAVYYGLGLPDRTTQVAISTGLANQVDPSAAVVHGH